MVVGLLFEVFVAGWQSRRSGPIPKIEPFGWEINGPGVMAPPQRSRPPQEFRPTTSSPAVPEPTSTPGGLHSSRTTVLPRRWPTTSTSRSRLSTTGGLSTRGRRRRCWSAASLVGCGARLTGGLLDERTCRPVNHADSPRPTGRADRPRRPKQPCVATTTAGKYGRWWHR